MKHFFIQGLFLVCLVALSTSLAHAKSSPLAQNHNNDDRAFVLPKSMASIGESISAGALAQFTRADASNPLTIAKLLFDFIEYGFTKSIGVFEARGLSWATGLDSKVRVASHAQVLKFLAREGRFADYPAYEAGISGGDSSTIQKQMEKIETWSGQTLGKALPDYLVFLMGANDACDDDNSRMTPTEVYERRLREFLVNVGKKSPKTKVLLSSMPNLETLRLAALKRRDGAIGSCRKMWKAHGFCKNLLQEKDASVRAQVLSQANEYNSVLKRLAHEFNEREGQEWVRYSDRVFNAKFTLDHISLDCFHPDMLGQDLIATETFKDSWWYPELKKREKEFESYRKKAQGL